MNMIHRFQVGRNFLLWLRKFIHGCDLNVWLRDGISPKSENLSIMSGRLFEFVECFVPSTVLSVGLSRIQSFVLWDLLNKDDLSCSFFIMAGVSSTRLDGFCWFVMTRVSSMKLDGFGWILLSSGNKFFFVVSQLRYLRKSSTPTTRQFSSCRFFRVSPTHSTIFQVALRIIRLGKNL